MRGVREVREVRCVASAFRRKCIVAALAVTAALALPLYAQQPVRSGAERAGGPRWFSAWAAAHNVGRGVQGLSGGSVRLIVRPTLSGQSLRVKLSNIRGDAPAVFSSAFVGVSGTGASVVTGTNRRLTFNGAANLTLAPDAMVWSDPLPFDVRAF